MWWLNQFNDTQLYILQVFVKNLPKFIHLLMGLNRIRPNKKISVFWVTGLKNLGRVDTLIFFSGKNIILCILKGISPFKMNKFLF